MRRLVLNGLVDALSAWRLPALEVLDLNATLDAWLELER